MARLLMSAYELAEKHPELVTLRQLVELREDPSPCAKGLRDSYEEGILYAWSRAEGDGWSSDDLARLGLVPTSAYLRGAVPFAVVALPFMALIAAGCWLGWPLVGLMAGLLVSLPAHFFARAKESNARARGKQFVALFEEDTRSSQQISDGTRRSLGSSDVGLVSADVTG